MRATFPANPAFDHSNDTISGNLQKYFTQKVFFSRDGILNSARCSSSRLPWVGFQAS